MSTEVPSQLVAYHAFVKSMLSKGGTIDEEGSPAAFLEYQRQLGQLREALRPAVERFQQGEEASELDIDGLVEQILQGGEL